MDISIVFSVGSFVMSERVLKPKASLLAILGCLLCYDLTTKTNDSSSLRVYRGPALLGFTLMMCAYSLRTWRRNGVACDELIFLPGTVHGQRHGITTTTTDAAATAAGSAAAANAGAVGGETTANYAFRRSKSSPAKTSTSSGRVIEQSAINSTTSAASSAASCEGDVAAGVAPPRIIKSASSSPSTTTLPLSPPAGRSSMTAPSSLEMTALDIANGNNNNNNRNRTVSRAESSVDSIQAFSDSWDEDDDVNDVDMSEGGDEESNNIDDERVPLTANTSTTTARVTAAIPTSSIQLRTAANGTNAATSSSPTGGGVSGTTSSGNAAQDAVQRFSENHPRITFIGSFFFFRSSVSSEASATYAPSGPMVVGGALDLCMPTLFNFHLFTEAYHHIDEYGSDLPAKILPIIFLTILLGRCMFPPGKRARFWGTLKYTFMAPFHASRFRDMFIGDVLTSFVRPGQDILFALSYYITVMRGMISGEYGLSDSGAILESSWLLHNVVLPSVALLPLWWRFLQTLRQAYDSGTRWPHLGNAFKYLSASLVILYGMTHPEDRRSPWWIVSFGLCLLYQLWWDVVMDWDLFVIVPREDAVTDHPRREGNSFLSFPTTSSYQGDSYILPLRMLFWQPIKDMTRFVCTKIPKIAQIQLRKRRLYKTESFYWRILAYNVIFRFAWMLCYIPAYRLSASGVEHVTTFSSDTNSYVGVLLPVAELLRRTFWGFLLLEKETIRMQDEDPTYSRIITNSISSSNMGGGGIDGGSGHRENGEKRRDSDIIILGETSSSSSGGGATGGGGVGGVAATVASKNESSVDVEMGNDSENGRKLRYLPAWLASTLQHHEDAAGMTTSSSANIIPSRCRCPSTLSSSSSSWLGNIQSKFAECLHLTDHTRHQLFTAELTVWAIAFIMLGLWATT